MVDEGRQRVLSTVGIDVDVDVSWSGCTRCTGPIVVQKTLHRRVITLQHGAFVARETVKVCAAGCRSPSGKPLVIRPEELSALVPRGAVFGYDLEVHIGLQRFLHQRQREEIRRDLKEQHGITISSGQVSIMTARFVDHLEALHRNRAKALRQAMAQDGGYPMQIDATGEDGRGTLLVTYAGWRGWVLGAWKVPTERSDKILPRLLETVMLFSAPVAIIRDLGQAVSLATAELVSEIGKPVPILACHLHFLADIGKDLLQARHDEIRRLFRTFRICPGLHTIARELTRRLEPCLPTLRAEVADWADEKSDHTLPPGNAGLAALRSLTLWILDYSTDGERLGFPFDRPYLDLYERCRTARRATDAYLRHPPAHTSTLRTLRRLARLLDPVVSSPSFAKEADLLSSRAGLFDELRAALRIYCNDGPEGPAASQEQAAAEVNDIRKALATFTQLLRNRRPNRGPAQDMRAAIDLVLKHLDRHGDFLWGHVIKLPRKAGGGIRVVDRTNNQLESLFHWIKHAERRRSGRKLLTQDLDRLPPASALVQNLTRPDYVQILCGSLEQLPTAFAQIDRSAPSTVLPFTRGGHRKCEKLLAPESDTVPRSDARFLRSTPLRERFEAAARSRPPRYIPVV